MNMIRKRAGIPGYGETVNLPKPTTTEEVMELIRKEKRIELSFENCRYFDVRRWMIADKDGEGRQNGYAHGMNVRGTINDTEEFNRVVETEKIVFNRKMYLQPIPDHEMRKTQNLVQNPGW